MNNMCLNHNWYNEKDGAINEDFIREHEVLRPHGVRHCPISSADILTKFKEKANILGLKLKNEKAGLLKTSTHIDKSSGETTEKGGDRFMYIAEVEDNNHPDYALSIGFRNYGDTTLSFSGMCGTQIFVCSNGCCSSIVKPSKMKHTIGNVNQNFINGKIDNIFSRFLEDSDKIHQQISVMKGTKLSDELVGKFVRKAIGDWCGDKFKVNQYIGSKNITRILEDLENPAYNDHNDNSVFRLLNACTKVTTHNMKNPNQSLMASRFCNNLIMSLIDNNFTPLGDDVIEAEEIEVVDPV